MELSSLSGRRRPRDRYSPCGRWDRRRTWDRRRPWGVAAHEAATHRRSPWNLRSLVGPPQPMRSPQQTESPQSWCRCGTRRTPCRFFLSVRKVHEGPKARKQKITKVTCKMKQRPRDEWRSSARLAEAEQDLHKCSEDGHDLEWNREVGKEPFVLDTGLIFCTRCERRWYWKDRVQNLRRTTCEGAADGGAQGARKEPQGHRDLAAPQPRLA